MKNSKEFLTIASGSFMASVCIIYYTIVFYVDKIITFEKGMILSWVLFGITTLSCLFLGLYNSYNVSILKTRSKELKIIIEDVAKRNNINHFDSLKEFQISKELLLEVLEVLENK